MDDNGDDVCYSTVNIKNNKPPPKENEEDATVYSEVKRKKACPAETSQAEKETAALCHSALFLVCLGILCVLLVVSIGVIIHMSMQVKKQQENISNLTSGNQRLIEEREMMQSQNKELSRERDDLNRTLGFIMKFDNFPVKDFCSDKKCQPCLKGWITFQKKCYLFSNDTFSWKTWKKSRELCQGKQADLVVIDDLQEQEFVHSHTKYYFSEYHGYWLGLHETNKTWIWVDGHEDTLGDVKHCEFWACHQPKSIPYITSKGPNALLIPGRNLTESWNKGDDVFRIKFICEHEALIWSI